MELKLLVADVLVLWLGPEADVIILVLDVAGSDAVTPAVLVVMLLVVVIVDVVIAEDDEIVNDGDRNGEPATPTISEISSENRRDGEKGRDGLKLISRPSSVNGECNGVILCGLVRIDGDDLEDVVFVEEVVVVFCIDCWTIACE